MNETPDSQQSDTTHPVSPRTVEQSQKPSKLPWIILGIVTLIAAGAITWLFLQNQSTHDSLTSTEQQLKTAKASLSAKASLATSNDKIKDSVVTTDTTTSDDDQAVKTTIAWAQAHKGSEDAKLTVAVSKMTLPFARTTVNTGESGYACVLKKSNDIWLVLFCGQDSPTQDVLDMWGVPASMLTSQ